MKRIGLFLATLLVWIFAASVALAGSGGVVVKDGNGTLQTLDTVTDGVGGQGYKLAVCDGAALANCVTVDSNGGLFVSHGNIGGYDFFVSQTPTIQAAQYVSGNCMGGFQAVAIATTTGVTGILDKITLISKGGLVTAKQLYVFTSNPSGSTCTDKSTFTIAAADLPKLMTTLSITPVVPTGGAASVGEASNLVNQFVTSGNANLYVAIVETTTETPGSTSDLVLNIGGVKNAP
jgi:hypothetical protein